MRLRYVVAAVAAAVFLAAPAFYYYPRLLRASGPPLEEKFRELYSSDAAFRSAVDEPRAMVLDPQVPCDKGRALQLFNIVLGKLELRAPPFRNLLPLALISGHRCATIALQPLACWPRTPGLCLR